MPKIFNKQGNLVFSKFDLTSQVDLAAERQMAKDRESKKQRNKSSLQGLLMKAKKDEQKVTHLQATNSKAAQKFKKQKIWQTVLEKSEGNKVRDDPQLIEKSLKKMQKRKSKTFKSWNERKESVEQRKQGKQNRRQRMLEEQKNKRKERRLKRFQKKRNT
ncbi:surfeit locus protein 6-like protein [Euroglyphus maynei]|uniref:Surfeit locus protein 6-like protein n=1 Tax=Euroglyphus maynei TaxID=6958 RepID=A0A1Y3BK59_EURMA|nr:surfeit locus protein 6-like protein [Euroglyphus maynei]